MYQFKSLQELYNRIRPVLISKKEELIKCGINNIKEIDIWNYLATIKWKNSTNLTISEMVNDIFKLKIDEIEKYYKVRDKNGI